MYAEGDDGGLSNVVRMGSCTMEEPGECRVGVWKDGIFRCDGCMENSAGAGATLTDMRAAFACCARCPAYLPNCDNHMCFVDGMFGRNA